MQSNGYLSRKAKLLQTGCVKQTATTNLETDTWNDAGESCCREGNEEWEACVRDVRTSQRIDEWQNSVGERGISRAVVQAGANENSPVSAGGRVQPQGRCRRRWTPGPGQPWAQAQGEGRAAAVRSWWCDWWGFNSCRSARQNHRFPAFENHRFTLWAIWHGL